ncbi:MAG: hypothetical protein GX117_11105, partial [Candidatus Hydrogenedentes bacterium]|nr:hypothetical protein [Candidatus Hydrogenedentota bacterium]
MIYDDIFDDDRSKTNDDTGADDVNEDSGGLGNLPPLSDFDSQEGASDADDLLPPLGDFESRDSSIVEGDSGDEIHSRPPVEDVLASGAGFADFDGSKSEGVDFGLTSGGFQDLAADSDFSPETPDIGPGPDTTLDTPIFDSAFGSSDSGLIGGPAGAVTQAMETPMFDDFGGGSDFDSPTGITPVPDFGPDTGFDSMQPDMVGAPVGHGPSGPPHISGSGPVPPRKGVGPLWIIIIGLVSLA